MRISIRQRRRWQAACLAALLTAAGCSSSKQAGVDAAHSAWEDVTSLETIEGKASYYSNRFHGRKTASGERYDKGRLTAAHKSYPFGTTVRVTSLENGNSTIVRINDRGPSRGARVIDLSYAAARELDMIRDGVVKVKMEVLDWGE